MSQKHILGDGPIVAAYQAQMQAIAEVLDDYFNPGVNGPERRTGFVLLVFPFGDDPKQRCNFISNGADRKDIVSLFREMIARFEGMPGSAAGFRVMSDETVVNLWERRDAKAAAAPKYCFTCPCGNQLFVLRPDAQLECGHCALVQPQLLWGQYFASPVVQTTPIPPGK